MSWELDHEPLAPLGDLGISNVIEDARACVTCHAGILACYFLKAG